MNYVFKKFLIRVFIFPLKLLLVYLTDHDGGFNNLILFSLLAAQR